MSPHRAVVHGRTLVLSEHAIARYQERVKPALVLAEALEDLRRVLVWSETSSTAPQWVRDVRLDADWLVLSDAIAFPVIGGHVATCLTRAVPGDDVQVERSRERRERSEDRRRPGRRQKHGKVARSEGARRRAVREAFDG